MVMDFSNRNGVGLFLMRRMYTVTECYWYIQNVHRNGVFLVHAMYTEMEYFWYIDQRSI